jgi:hypothetical protein
MKLRELPCKTWTELVEYIENHQLPLLLSTEDKRCVTAAKHCKEFGASCAAAIVCAELYKDENRAIICAHWALNAYRRICPDRMDEWNDLGGWLAWAGVPMKGRENNWPIRPRFANEQEEAGMANVMFRLALEDLFEGTTSEKVAAMKIFEFLDEGMKKKEAENGLQTRADEQPDGQATGCFD